MSRIYDALQRAHRERTNPQGSEAGQLPDLSNASDIVEPLRHARPKSHWRISPGTHGSRLPLPFRRSQTAAKASNSFAASARTSTRLTMRLR